MNYIVFFCNIIVHVFSFTVIKLASGLVISLDLSLRHFECLNLPTLIVKFCRISVYSILPDLQMPVPIFEKKHTTVLRLGLIGVYVDDLFSYLCSFGRTR